jgi:hypothetical protein
MKCKYQFQVLGKIKISDYKPINVRGKTYELDVNAYGVITHISVTVLLNNTQYHPRILPSQEEGVKLLIIINDGPYIELVKKELRIVEGLLSLYGLTSIDLNSPYREWIPETEEERKELQLFNYQEKIVEVDDSEIPVSPFDLIARSFIGADRGFEIEIPLNFFRKGQIDFNEGRYIEAIYDFYFLLESLYANGQFREKSVITAFEKSAELTGAIRTVLQDSDCLSMERDVWNDIVLLYGNKSMREVLEEIVKLRGFLHHHTLKRKDIWHPEEHNTYKIKASFLQNIAFHVAFALSDRCIFDEEVISEYNKRR